MIIPDPRRLSSQQRHAIATRARRSYDAQEFTSQIQLFNSSPCAKHDEITRGCNRCGIRLRRHQRVGTAWLWFRLRGLLADSCGLGKTAQVAAVLAIAKQTGELSYQNRCVIIAQASAVGQWTRELKRFVPSLQVVKADGTPSQRMDAYLGGWEVCVISSRTLAPAGQGRNARDGDIERLRQFPIGIVVFDDVDEMRNGRTRTAWAVRKLCESADRVIACHATPLQKRLVELYNFLVPLGALQVFGTENQFRADYVTRGQIFIWVAVIKATPAEKNAWARKHDFISFAALQSRAQADKAAGLSTEQSKAMRLMAGVRSGRARLRRGIWKDTGVVERRIPEFKRMAGPMILRRTASDLDDVELPDVQTSEVWLDLLPQQRERYKELQQGVLKRLRDTGTEISQPKAAVAWTRGAQICSGLAALDDGRDVSVKLDWCVDRITGDLSEDKVFCFVYFKPNVQALSNRLAEQGVGHVLLWSQETNAVERDRRMQRFTEDPDCRVVIATTTAERSLNLQAASHLIAVDTILNPARMTQILGRIRRDGSRHSMVLFHHLLCRGTQEEDYLPILESEQALANSIWEDRGELFSPSDLSPRRQLEIIARMAS